MELEFYDSDLWFVPLDTPLCEFQLLADDNSTTPLPESADSLSIDSMDLQESSASSDHKSLKWTQAEITLLQELKADETLTYERISQIFECNGFHKSVQSIEQRWTKVERPGLVKGRMTFAEENQIMRFFNESNGNLKYVARMMPTRSIMQIRRKCQQLGLMSVKSNKVDLVSASLQ